MTYYIETERPRSEGRPTVLIWSVIRTRRKNIGKKTEYVEEKSELADLILDTRELKGINQTESEGENRDDVDKYEPVPEGTIMEGNGRQAETISEKIPWKEWHENQLSPQEYEHILAIQGKSA